MKNKNIIIFGASGDIGLCLAQNYFDQGYNLVLTYNKKNKIKKFFKNRAKKSNKIYYLNCNFNNEKSIHKVIAFTFKTLGEPTFIFNSVGTFYYDTLKKFNYKKITETFRINSFSVLAINKALLNLKKKNNLIKVISIGSSSAINGFKDTFSYCGSKHALSGIVKSLNETIYKKKVFNYCLNFGSIKNKMGRKVRNEKFEKFIDQKSVVKTFNFVTNSDLPAFPEEIYIKRSKY